MKRALCALATCTSLAAATAACGNDDGTEPAGPSGSARQETQETRTAARTVSAPVASQSRRRGKTVKVVDSRYGRILADGRGRALYLFTRERSKRSRCYGACAAAWPPLLTRGRPRSGDGASGDLLSTTRRRDGRAQVTYRGHPLYYYVDDREPGQVLCQDVEEFGGTWYVVAPAGNAIT